jgi:hypothetical protein
MKTYIPLLGLCSLLFFAGCEGVGTPGGAVTAAGQALQTGNLKAFRGVLTGEALQDYGNPSGMASLKQELEVGEGIPHLGATRLITREIKTAPRLCVSAFHPHEPGTLMTEGYQVEILLAETSSPARVAEVHCLTCLRLDRRGYLLERFSTECRIASIH